MNRIERAVAKAFDNFIRETGGNIDPRAANNRERAALKRFYDRISRLESDDMYGIQIPNAMKRIINERIIYESDHCPPKFAVYDHLGNKEPSGESSSHAAKSAASGSKKPNAE